MIGPKNKGLNSMFTMMNLERIVVGIQGLGISEIAYQNSLSYAKERKQGKTNNSKSTNGADLIIEHVQLLNLHHLLTCYYLFCLAFFLWHNLMNFDKLFLKFLVLVYQQQSSLNSS